MEIILEIIMVIVIVGLIILNYKNSLKLKREKNVSQALRTKLSELKGAVMFIPEDIQKEYGINKIDLSIITFDVEKQKLKWVD